MFSTVNFEDTLTNPKSTSQKSNVNAYFSTKKNPFHCGLRVSIRQVPVIAPTYNPSYKGG
jgi:hypothetical protein